MDVQHKHRHPARGRREQRVSCVASRGTVQCAVCEHAIRRRVVHDGGFNANAQHTVVHEAIPQCRAPIVGVGEVAARIRNQAWRARYLCEGPRIKKTGRAPHAPYFDEYRL
mgnify:CR=1 FL=1